MMLLLPIALALPGIAIMLCGYLLRCACLALKPLVSRHSYHEYPKIRRLTRPVRHCGKRFITRAGPCSRHVMILGGLFAISGALAGLLGVAVMGVSERATRFSREAIDVDTAVETARDLFASLTPGRAITVLAVAFVLGSVVTRMRKK